MKRLRNCLIALAALASVTPGVASAALFVRPGGMVYDDFSNVTWLSNASLNGGFADWDSAYNWAANLVYGGFDDWRLPSVYDPNGTTVCQGFGCQNSELGHMYYVNLGASAMGNIAVGSNAANLALFTNLVDANGGGRFALNEEFNTLTKGNLGQFECTNLTPGSSTCAFAFRNDGIQSYGGKQQAFQGWAVRDGDVLAPGPVPEPSTWALMIGGFGGAGAMLRHRRRALAS